MNVDSLMIWGIGLGLVSVTVVPVILRTRRRDRETEEARLTASRYGLDEPQSLHPVVDPNRCIGSGSCVTVCPEDVLGIEVGQAVAVTPAHCIGHGLCERSCPMDAIQLVFGTEKRGIDLPRVQENFETNVPGIYIVGELGGMGLVANAFEQGRQCVDGIVREGSRGPDGILDLVVVGCGPAGLSTSLSALRAGLDFVTVEREDVGGTVRHYPRKKLVMTRPVKVPGWGKLPLREISKEELIRTWQEIARDTGLEVRTGETVGAVEKIAPYHFRVTTGSGSYETRRVVLAIGRRGVPRKLGVPGEEAPHVSYSLRDPEAFTEDRILVVGGGDSAVEAALALAEEPGNEVRISYRRDRFRRIKPANHERIGEAENAGRLAVVWNTEVRSIRADRVALAETGGGTLTVPADQVFVFVGGELPTPFLRRCGIEIETKFGVP